MKFRFIRFLSQTDESDEDLRRLERLINLGLIGWKCEDDYPSSVHTTLAASLRYKRYEVAELLLKTVYANKLNERLPFIGWVSYSTEVLRDILYTYPYGMIKMNPHKRKALKLLLKYGFDVEAEPLKVEEYDFLITAINNLKRKKPKSLK